MPPLVLAINAGTSSLKTALIDAAGERVLDVRATGVPDTPQLVVDGVPRDLACADIETAIEAVFDELDRHASLLVQVVAVGHRIAHGGDRHARPTLIDERVLADIESLTALAPLHNPTALAGVRAARARLPGLPQVAFFDTSFHATLPTRSREYALPAELRRRFGLRRYGFHGISHAWVAGRAAAYLGTTPDTLRLVTCHLGSGASACAIEFGRSIDTSMGYTPLEGLIMATRSGDVDPGILLRLAAAGYDAAALDHLLNHEAGLHGLAGTADMALIEQRAAGGDGEAQLALQLYCYRVRKYVGAYATVMGGMDALVFTGGIGEHSAVVRHRVAQRLEFLGAPIDEDANREAHVDERHPVAEISARGARCRILVVATDEERALARGTFALLQTDAAADGGRPIPVAVSARHVHLTQATVEALFGAGHRLTPQRPISQPGQYAAVEYVSVVGPRGRIEKVRVLGPTRAADQVEISRSDEFVLGLDAPVRESGDLAHTPGCRLEGPMGSVALSQGVICALRHIHMSPADAGEFRVADGDTVDVQVSGGERELTFGDVRIRVSDRFALEMHLDTDEGNAAGLCAPPDSVLEPVAHTARLVSKRPAP